jgi:tetratricopeptide (TPR) repeat protein
MAQCRSPKVSVNVSETTAKSRWWLLPLPLIAILVVAEIALRFAWKPPEYYEQHFLEKPYYVLETENAGMKTYITKGLHPDAFTGPDGAAPGEPPPMDPRQISPARIRMPKARQTTRIFVVGSSPVYGGPGVRGYNLSTYLERYLAAARPNDKFEIIDAAAQQMTADVLAELLAELGRFDPDFTLIYVGGAVPTLAAPGQGAAGVEPILYRVGRTLAGLYLVRVWGPTGERTVRDGVMAINDLLYGEGGEVDETNIQKNMLQQASDEMVTLYRRMAATAAETPGRVAFYEVASDLAGSWPVWSLHFTELTKEQEKQFDKALAAAKGRLAAEDFAAVFESAKQALAIDDTYAEAHFVLGKALLGLGRADDAYRSFDRARETDASHDRLYSVPKRELAKALEQRDLTLLPTEIAFREQSETGVPGRDLFRDITHPTPLGEAVLGRIGAAWILTNLPGENAAELPPPMETVGPLGPAPPLPGQPPPDPEHP